MSLASQVGLLATRVGTELKSIRTSFVPNTQRGPIGGVTATSGVTGTVTINPASAVHQRLSLAGDTTIAAMAAGADGQRLLIEANAVTTQRVLTFDPSFELSNAVPTRTFTIPSGAWAYVALVARGTTWRLVSAEPQTVTAADTAPGVWVPADHGVQAWSYDPIIASGAYVPATNGQMFGTAVKVSSAVTVSAVNYAMSTAGSGFTSGRNLVGLYNSTGTLLAQTADQSTTWTASGRFSSSLTGGSVALTAGTYYVNFLVTATTPPQVAASAVPVSAILTGRTANGYRGYWYSGVPTTLPNPRTTPSGPDRPMWVGLS